MRQTVHLPYPPSSDSVCSTVNSLRKQEAGIFIGVIEERKERAKLKWSSGGGDGGSGSSNSGDDDDDDGGNT